MIKKLLSGTISSLVCGVKNSCVNFYISFLAAILLTTFLTVKVFFPNFVSENSYYVATICFFITLFTFGFLFSILLKDQMGKKASPKMICLASLGSVLISCGVFLFIRCGFYQDLLMQTTLLLWAFSTTAFLFFMPFKSDKDSLKTWKHQRDLFVSFFFCMLFSLVVFLSLIAIEAAIVYLFNLEHTEILTQLIVIFSWAFFAPLSFLVLFTKTSKEPKETPPSNFFKIMVHYILLPLVCIYIVVLYVYLAKILITWNLPKGSVAYMVLALAAIGSLVWYFLRVLAGQEQKGWTTIYSKTFFPLLLPLLALLFVGLFRRIGDYGITTNRYLVCVIACWFVLVALLLIVRRKTKVAPIVWSAVVLALLLSFGPWSAFRLPRIIRSNQFENIAQQCHIMEAGKLVKAQQPITDEQNEALKKNLDFFFPDHRDYFLEKYTNIDTVVNKNDVFTVEDIFELFGGTSTACTDNEDNFFVFQSNLGSTFDVQEYDCFCPLVMLSTDEPSERLMLLDREQLEISFEENQLLFDFSQSGKFRVSAVALTGKQIDAQHRHCDGESPEMVTVSNEKIRLDIYVEKVQGTIVGFDSLMMEDVSLKLAIRYQ